MSREPKAVNVRLMTPEDRARVDELLRDIGGPNVSWGSVDVLNVWLAEKRMEADRAASRRVEIATWSLVVVTLVLALATVGLIVATLAD